MPCKAEIIHGNCIPLLNQESGVDLVFADPPFNIGQDYANYNDLRPAADYQHFTRNWFASCVKCLRDGGVLVTHVPDDLVHQIFLCAEEHKGNLRRIDWVVWHYRFGQCVRSKFINSKAHALIFKKGDADHTWNPSWVSEPSVRKEIGDPRTEKSKTPGERVLLDVWYGDNLGRVQGNNKERVPERPNQLPELYVSRFIRAYTNPGDTVADPFVGTGTTPVVAAALGRNFIGFDVDEQAVELARLRLEKGCVRDVAAPLGS